jgi:hypothetical protein
MMIITERERERGFHQKILHSKSQRDHDASWGPPHPSCFTCETCSVVLHLLCVRACVRADKQDRC